jgi:NAD(P)-dependent dehydrogenase (short-subunit alcohol dehydrogenase family)
MDYSGREVIVTGGTGALGSAVVGALVEAGAICYVPWRHETEARTFSYKEHNQVRLFGTIDLADESAVKRFFGEVPRLWASIHVAGGFAMAPVAKTGKSDRMHLIVCI